MIQPVRKGRELLDEIDNEAAPAPVLWWLGQSGFVVKYRRIVFYLDPYLSESLTKKYADTNRPHIRMTEAPFRGDEVIHADLVFSTHGHSDHLDPGTVPAILASSPEARLVLPKALVEKARAMGVPRERMRPTDADDTIEFRKDGAVATIHPIPSAHEQLDWSPESGYPHLGYVIRFGECTIYQPGDCVPYDGLVERLRPFGVTVALLPVNGRDPARGVAGNFNIPEAAQLVEEIGARWLVPAHYDMFTFNTVDISLFVEHMKTRPKQNFKILRCGERWAVPE